MDERKKNEAKTRKMNTFANRSLPVQLSLAKLFTFRWQFTIIPALVPALQYP